MNFQNYKLSWKKSSSKYPCDGMDHYGEKSNCYFGSKEGEIILSEFEKEFAKFEKEYFEQMPQSVQITTSMLCPLNTRFIWTLNTFTK